jgi:hypothetical protein
LLAQFFNFQQDSLAQLAAGREDHDTFHEQFASSDFDNTLERPHSIFFQPVYSETYNNTSDIVGILVAVVGWDVYFANILPEHVKGVLENSCGQSFTYHVDGNTVSVNNGFLFPILAMV